MHDMTQCQDDWGRLDAHFLVHASLGQSSFSTKRGNFESPSKDILVIFTSPVTYIVWKAKNNNNNNLKTWAKEKNKRSLPRRIFIHVVKDDIK